MSDPELPHILCVDDEEFVLKALSRVLRKKYHVHSFSGSVEALKAFKENPLKFSLVITDLKMPEMDGLTLLKEIKKIDPDCVAIVLSGFEDFKETLNAINHQLIFKYLQKPWEDTLLETAVQEGILKKMEIQSRDEIQKKLSETFSVFGSSNPLTGEVLEEIKRMAETGVMSSRILHDLNNQLLVLDMALELLESHKEGTAAGTSIFPTMKHAISSITAMIDDLQAYISCRHSHLALQPLSLNEILKQFRSSMVMYFMGKPVNMVYDLEKDFVVFVDPLKIERVLINLAKNAAEAMEEGEYRISTLQQENRVRIEFKDTGAGMTDDVKNNLFKVYMTSKQKGTGVGLINVRDILEAHGGSIHVESEPGKGTSIFIFLPLHNP